MNNMFSMHREKEREKGGEGREIQLRETKKGSVGITREKYSVEILSKPSRIISR